jgi:hypothetical protein
MKDKETLTRRLHWDLEADMWALSWDRSVALNKWTGWNQPFREPDLLV